ncbi:hypothetical protein POX_b02586 [Penicillium oxalicum]|uniref:Uncharacterized protein n=1 Tax=Penicillium oxalicum (strain 114-2 / CGMCC 5302) TaxID=933388 RepID=S7ZIF0_PENO1|nr:hypothetical protein POX_b02586 [Penicillium oxalicum]EPS30405.1 hypothetical protein PDE_05356 [Penicillium oxalicum 114-2]KAI2792548.1 hypothetical protein POX_b02586 [Penicillium oxalicum]
MLLYELGSPPTRLVLGRSASFTPATGGVSSIPPLYCLLTFPFLFSCWCLLLIFSGPAGFHAFNGQGDVDLASIFPPYILSDSSTSFFCTTCAFLPSPPVLHL